MSEITSHKDIKEFFEKNAVSNADKKYSQFSVTTPFAWHPDRILLQKSDDPAVQEMQGLVKNLANQALGCRATFFSDAIELAMVEYRHLHNKFCAATVLIAFDVLTNAGDNLVYTTNIDVSEFHNTTDLFDFTKEIMRPTSLKLVNRAIKDSKFENVLSVTAYVGEIFPMSVSDYSVLQLDIPSEERN